MKYTTFYYFERYESYRKRYPNYSKTLNQPSFLKIEKTLNGASPHSQLLSSIPVFI